MFVCNGPNCIMKAGFLHWISSMADSFAADPILTAWASRSRDTTGGFCSAVGKDRVS